jgi:hypothetical protein
VTVLDTGLDRTHPDFGTPGNCQLAENDCGAASTGVVIGTTPAGHGTQVAGIIAAKTNNTVGVAGVAYGSKIHSIVIPNWTTSGMAQGFTDTAAYGLASVINASFGGFNAFVDWTPVCTAINSTVVNNGVPVAMIVNAAGNWGANGGNWYPGRCGDSNPAMTRPDLMIIVSASSSAVEPSCGSVAIDQHCSFSNFGAWVDIAAPGGDIRSTALGGGYISQAGTSFSAPIVVGAVAILKSCGVPLEQMKSTLVASSNIAVPYPAYSTFPAGTTPLLDIYRAMLSRNRAPTSLSISNTGLNDLTDTSAGTEVGTLTTADADTCDKHIYSISGGADAAMFRIGGAAGDRLILTAGVLNYASKSSYAVTLHVTDYFNATPATDLPVTVNVIPANNAPTIAAQSFTVNENSASGTSVGTVVASDPDSGNTLGYSITSGNTGNAFSIANTGVLSVNNSAALGSTFNLVVTVTDNFGASANATVTVNINNAPTISSQSFSINEGSSNGTPVGNVIASDPNGNAVSYSILAGNTNNAFLLDATTGSLSVNNSAALVFAATPSFNLTVRVADGGGLTASANVTVNLNAVAAPTPPSPPPTSGGGGGCSVMPAGAVPDSSLLLVMMVVLGYGLRRRKKG